METLKAIAAIGLVFGFSFGIIFVIGMLPEHWRQFFVWALCALVALSVLWAITTDFLKNRKEFARAEGLVDRFLQGDHNDATEIVHNLAHKRKWELEADLRSFILMQLKREDLKESDISYYIRQLVIIAPKEAEKITEKIQGEITAKIKQKVEAGVDSIDVLQFISSQSAQTSPCSAAGSREKFYNDMVSAARPCVRKMAEAIEGGRQYVLSIRLCTFSSGRFHNTAQVSFLIGIHNATVGNMSVPLANFVKFTKSKFCTEPLTFIYMEPDRIVQAYGCEPVQTLILELVEELRRRLPEQEREPDESVINAIIHKRDTMGMEFIDYQEMLRREEDERLRIYDEADNASIGY